MRFLVHHVSSGRTIEDRQPQLHGFIFQNSVLRSNGGPLVGNMLGLCGGHKSERSEQEGEKGFHFNLFFTYKFKNKFH